MVKKVFDMKKGIMSRLVSRSDLVGELGDLLKEKSALVELGEDTSFVDAKILSKKEAINSFQVL